MFPNTIRNFIPKVKIKSVLEGGTPLFSAMLLPQVVCTLLMCNQVVDGWSPVIFTFVLTPGIPDQFSLHDITPQGRGAGVAGTSFIYTEGFFPQTRGSDVRPGWSSPHHDLLGLWFPEVSLSTPLIWNLSKQHPQAEARVMYSLLYTLHRDSPLLSFFLKSTSGLFSRTASLQLPGTLRHKIRTKRIHLECLAFPFLHQGEGSSFILHIVSTHEADWDSSSSNCNGYLLGY